MQRINPNLSESRVTGREASLEPSRRRERAANPRAVCDGDWAGAGVAGGRLPRPGRVRLRGLEAGVAGPGGRAAARGCGSSGKCEVWSLRAGWSVEASRMLAPGTQEGTRPSAKGSGAVPRDAGAARLPASSRGHPRGAAWLRTSGTPARCPAQSPSQLPAALARVDPACGGSQLRWRRKSSRLPARLLGWSRQSRRGGWLYSLQAARGAGGRDGLEK